MASPSTPVAATAAAAPGSSDKSGDKSSAAAATAEASAAAAPASPLSSLTSPGSVAFSSQPVAPVVASSHARRPSTDASGSGTGARSDNNSSSANEYETSNSNGAASTGSDPSKNKHTSSSRGGLSRRTASPPLPYSSGSETESSEDERSKSNAKSKKSSSRLPSQPSQSQDANSSSGDSSGSSSAPPSASPTSTDASMSLPSISGAALLQLRGSGNPQALERISSIQPAEKRSDEAYDAPGAVASRHYRRSRSRSRERSLSSSASASRWATGNNAPAAAPIAHETDAMPVGRGDDRMSFSGPGDDRDVRILFHGREIFPDDLIGLRVSKTFAGHGRFLGQVVKFDEPSLLYTVVYADGDAEELSIDNTLQILIQDEIERADPSLPPIAAAAVPSAVSYPPPQPRPESPSVQSGPSASPMPQQRQPQGHSFMAPGAGPPPPSGAAPGPQRAAAQISEREAQFVVSLFENHALPTLLRDGWKVRTSASGTETRFSAPPGHFPGAGRVFPSPLAVVEFIASDRELLAACFPQNVHAAILSLFPDSTMRARESSRKRVGPGEPDPYDLKRQRSGREDLSGAAAAAASHMRSGPPPHQQRHGGYPPGDDRDAYAPVGPGDRFSSGGGPLSSTVRESSRSGMRPHHHVDASEYRRVASDSHAPPARVSSSRWPESSSSGTRPSPVDVAEYRRQYAGSPEWREHDMVPPRRPPYASEPPQLAYHDGPPVYRSHSRSDDMPPPYYSDHTSPHTGMRAPMGDVLHRYHDSRGSPSRQSPCAEHFHRHGSARGPPPAPPSADGPHRASPPPEYRRAPMGVERSSGSRSLPPGHDPAVSSSTMVQQQVPSGPSSRGPPFSMVNADRNVHPRSGALSPGEQQWDARRKATDRSGFDHSSATAASSSHRHHHHHRRHQQHGYNDAPSTGRLSSERMSEPQRASASSPSRASASAMGR